MFNDKINVPGKKTEYSVVHFFLQFCELCKVFGQYLFSVEMNIYAHWHSTTNNNRKNKFESLIVEAFEYYLFI